MPSPYPKLQKMLLCNPKPVFYYKSYKKNFHDTKYCTFHRSVIIVSFSNLSYKIIYIWWQSKQPPFPIQKKKSNCHICLWEIYTETHHFETNAGRLVAHAEWRHCQNSREITISYLKMNKQKEDIQTKENHKIHLTVLGHCGLVYRLEISIAFSRTFWLQ